MVKAGGNRGALLFAIATARDRRTSLTASRTKPYDESVGVRATPCARRTNAAAMLPIRRLLPPRSTAGQLTLDQHIGVRIPGGQKPKLFIIRHLVVHSTRKARL